MVIFFSDFGWVAVGHKAGLNPTVPYLTFMCHIICVYKKNMKSFVIRNDIIAVSMQNA